MIGTIYIAMTGLRGYEQGLRVISNNTANLNTPGFKGSRIQFADLYNPTGSAGQSVPQGLGQTGYGLGTVGTMLELQQGQLQSTGNALDLAVDGEGMFILRDEAGRLRYTRDGQFKFDADGRLVSVTSGEEVMAFDGSRNLTPVTIGALGTNAAAATGTVAFKGNLSSSVNSKTVDGVVIVDRVGANHTLSVRLAAVAGMPGTWDVTVLDGTITVGNGRIAFINGQPDPAQSKVTFTYTQPGQTDMPVTLDFSTNVTSFDSGSLSTLAFASQDGRAQGVLTGVTFDADGVLQITYSNGQKVAGVQLALARYPSVDSVQQVGTNQFVSADGVPWESGVGQKDGFGAVRSGTVEVSNIDLSQEFTDLVIMQRGFQASSQVISTANEMLAELFGMRGK
jgi:flagellar hook protein FlgE